MVFVNIQMADGGVPRVAPPRRSRSRPGRACRTAIANWDIRCMDRFLTRQPRVFSNDAASSSSALRDGRLLTPGKASAHMDLADQNDRRNVGEVGDVGLRLGPMRLERAGCAVHIVEAKFGDNR